MATLLELAELSAVIYGDSPLPSGWKVFYRQAPSTDGYLGVAYEKVDANGNPVLNPDGTTDIVIANRGTDLKNFSNLTNMMNVLSDIELAAGQKTAVQGDAAAFAASVVAYAQNNGLKANFIETGHSLGGNEAQAAVVALTNAGIPVSAVTFDSPGIGGYPYNATTAYNVTNLYTQGDAIHLAGGVHLGTSVMLPAGPNTSSLALGSPLAVATGPAGVFGLLGTALWDVLGPAHAMQTVIGYLQNTNSALGNLNSGAVGSIPSLLPVTVPTGPVMRVNPNGSLTLTDAGGNGVTFDTGATGQTVTATFTDGTGTGIYSELARLGNVTLPGSELNQNVAALTGAASINESITRNASGTFDVAFSSTGSSDQFAVTTANNSTSADTGFNYAVPSGMQTVVETIDNGDNNAPGTVSVIAGSTVTQLDGGTAVAGTDTTWTDSHGDQYVYNSDTGSMTISQGLLGTGGDQIVIDNFNLGQAESSTGYLGIKFGEQLAMAASANSADDPFTNGGNYTAASQSAMVATGNVQTITLYASAASSSDQTITLNGGGASLFVSTGADLLPFNGTLDLTIPAGQDHVTVALMDASNSSSPSTVNLTASMTDANGTVSSNALSVTFVSPNPAAGNTPPAGTPSNTITGDLQPAKFLDANGNVYYKYDSLGNIITDGVADPNRNDTLFGSPGGNDLINAGGGNNVVVANGTGNDTITAGNGNDSISAGSGNNSITDGNGNDTISAGAGNNTITGGTGQSSITAGNGNNVISGSGGQDVILAGNGNNQIYAGQQTDLAGALTQAQTGASGQTGDFIAVGSGASTLVGGAGNDAFILGGGNDLVIMGPGNDTVFGGDTASAVGANWSTQNSIQVTSDITNYKVSFQNAGLASSGGYTGNSLYPEINTDSNGTPLGGGNETILGGAGNNFILGSNGTGNYIDVGSGNSTVFSGAGNDTIFAGTGNSTINGQAGNDYIVGETGNDWIEGGSGNNTIYGGSGNDSIVAGEGGQNWADLNLGDNYVDGGSGNSVIYGSGGNDTLIGGSGNTTIFGGNGMQSIVGGSGADLLVGGNGTDTLDAGGNGNDTLQAGNGSSTLYGGGGTDILEGGSNGAADVIYAGDGGTTAAPTQLYTNFSDSSLYGGAGVDELFGGANFDTLYAGSGTDTLQGGSGTEVMYSSIGDATLIAGSGSDTLYGGSGSDVLQGSSGNTLFVAGSGTETILGGSGSNIYQFNNGFGTVELGNTTSADTLEFGAGITLANLTVSATLDSNGAPALLIQTDNGGMLTIEGGLDGAINQFAFADGTQLTLAQLMAQGNTTPSTTAGANGNLLFSANGTDSLAGGSGNDTLYGWNSNNLLTAGTGNQVLNSESGNDTLVGGAGNDTLVSLAGNDTLNGGTGNTTFVVNTTTDVINAQIAGTNVNTVQSSVSYTAPNNVQDLTLTGTADLTATGNNLNNTLTANSGNDTLIAGTGIATLVGGTGNDTFVVNNAADVVQAQSNGTNVNTVQSSVSYAAPTNVQNLTLTGTADLSATGNDLNNTLTANNGNDTLIAGTGIATLVGGTGNDTFVVNNAADVVQAQYGATNTVLSSVDYVAPTTVEKVTLTGTANLTATDNDGVLTANSGNDTLIAGTGNGTLIGGTGTDTFVFGAGTGTYTAINQPSSNAIMQLAPGLDFSGLTAQRSGNALVLDNGVGSSIRLDNYFMDPQQWTLEDSQGNIATAQSLLAATAQLQSNSLLYQENQFIAGVRSFYTQNLINNGYVQQPDGSWYQAPPSWDNTIFWGDNFDFTFSLDSTYKNSSTNAFYSTTLPTQTSEWYMLLNYISDDATSIQQTVINTSAPVINASSSSSSYTEDSIWYKINWETPQETTTKYGPLPIDSALPWAPSNFSYYPGIPIVNNTFPTSMAEFETVHQYSASGTVSGGLTGGVLTSPGNLTIQGPFPQAVNAIYDHYHTIEQIQQINLGSGNHTVYGATNQRFGMYKQVTMVSSGVGNNVINNAGFVDAGTGNDIISNAGTVFGGGGNDTIYGAGMVYAGSGNDLIQGAGGVVAGSGNDTIFGSYGGSNVTINPATSGMDLIGNNASQFGSEDAMLLSALGDSLESYQYGGMYQCYGGYFDTALEAWQTQPFETVQQELADGSITYVAPLTSLPIFADNALTPSSYYATVNLPTTTYSANDFSTLLPYFNNGTLSGMTVTFDAGITLANLNFSWGQVTTALSGISTDPQVTYTTLDMTWGVNQGVDIILPNATDLLGSGVQEFVFADGTRRNLAYMITLATLEGTGTYIYQIGMGAQTLGTGYTSIQFGSGITSSMITLGISKNGALLLQVGANGDVITIPQFNPQHADQALTSIQAFSFSDGTSMTYAQLLARGFDIHGSTGNESLTGTNLDNRISAGSGNDTLYGSGANDTLIAGTGTATMIGGTGNETFMVNNVNDVIQAQSTPTNINTVLSSVSYVAPTNVQNITLTGDANLTATGNASNNVITAGGGNDTLIAGSGVATMIGGFGSDTFVVNNINDVIQAHSTLITTNTVLSSVNYVAPANVQNITLTGDTNLTATGNALNNVLTANGGNDTLIAGTGMTTMIGGSGSDTFVVNAGTTLPSLTTDGNSDILDITGSVRTVTVNGNSNTIDATGSMKHLTVNGSDSTITASGVGSLNLSGNATLTGSNDTVNVGSGVTLTLGLGSGANVINTTSATTDVLSFGTGILDDQLWFSRSGNNLVVQVDGTGEAETISNWFDGGQYQLSATTAGGKSASAANVNALVQAMASMTPPPLGQTTLTAAQSTQLAPVLAANWH